MIRRLALIAAALALFSAAPAFAQSGGADREFSRLNADRAHRLGVQQYRTNNFDQALRQFEKAVALAPDVDNYRRSLNLTKQRIALEQARQRDLRDNAERTRRFLGGEGALPEDIESASPTRPSAPRSAVDPFGADPERRPAAARGPSEPTTPEAAVRAPDLGGDAMQRENPIRGGLPADLPVAGSLGGSLPIGRLPDELFQSPQKSTAREGDTEGTDDGTPPSDAILQPHLFPSLYPNQAPAPGGQPPRLDRPGTLP
jgi:hypothetical protein